MSAPAAGRAPWLAEFLAAEALPSSFAQAVDTVWSPLAERLAAGAARHGPGYTVGVCGAQGSGKSTACAVLARLLEARGLKVAQLSIDDLYLTRAEREALAARIHPLFAVRGPPGTHDVDLGERVLDALVRPGETALPRFDKARDDRAPPSGWPRFAGPADVILFEGWCVGARPQPAEDLDAPVNDLEQTRDPDGAWRRHVNAALAGPYQRLFARLDRFVLLQAPGFEAVLAWRTEQERKLRERLAREGADPARSMSDAEVARFVAHYERLTRWILAEAPARADDLVRLDAGRRAALS